MVLYKVKPPTRMTTALYNSVAKSTGHCCWQTWSERDSTLLHCKMQHVWVTGCKHGWGPLSIPQAWNFARNLPSFSLVSWYLQLVDARFWSLTSYPWICDEPLPPLFYTSFSFPYQCGCHTLFDHLCSLASGMCLMLCLSKTCGLNVWALKHSFWDGAMIPQLLLFGMFAT